MFWEMMTNDISQMRFRSICTSENSSQCPISSAHWLKVLHHSDTQRIIPSLPGKIAKTEIQKDKLSICYCNKNVFILQGKLVKWSHKTLNAKSLSHYANKSTWHDDSWNTSMFFKCLFNSREIPRNWNASKRKCKVYEKSLLIKKKMNIFTTGKCMHKINLLVAMKVKDLG